jgi:hypothetical protein
MLDTQTVIATPNPGPIAVTTAGGTAAVIAWGAGVLGAKWGVPPQVMYAAIGTLTTVATSLWHRFFGPKVPVTVPGSTS